MISRSGTRRSGASAGVTWILREAGRGPVVTCGVTRSVGAIGLFIGRSCCDPGDLRLWGKKSLSLRRYDPDQVQRVPSVPFGPAVSQLTSGAPLGTAVNVGSSRRLSTRGAAQ